MTHKLKALVGQYAKSIVEVAVEKGLTDNLYEEISDLLHVVSRTQMSETLNNLAISKDDKQQLVAQLQEVSSPYVSNFLAVILQNHREAYLEIILEEVLHLLTKETNTYDVSVTSAVTLSDFQKQRVESLVERKFGIKTRHLIEHVDPAIIGGFIITANNNSIDTSIRQQLQTLKRNLK